MYFEEYVYMCRTAYSVSGRAMYIKLPYTCQSSHYSHTLSGTAVFSGKTSVRMSIGNNKCATYIYVCVEHRSSVVSLFLRKMTGGKTLLVLLLSLAVVSLVVAGRR